MKFLGQRLGLSVLALGMVATVAFFLIHLIPGDPVDFILGNRASEMDRLQLRKALGLDQGLWSRYQSFMVGLLKGDMGLSLHTGRPVIQELGTALPATGALAFLTLVVSAAWGISLGVVCVLKKGWWDRVSSVVSLVLMSCPVFFMAPLLIRFFALELDWFPVSERGTWRSFVLPVFSLTLPLGSVIFKMTLAALKEVMGRDYIRTARAKGVSLYSRYFKHGLTNALIPIVTIVGLQGGALLTGTVIVESVFDWPGLGLLLLHSIQRRDYPLVQAGILLMACIYVLMNLLTDLVCRFIHPAMRRG